MTKSARVPLTPTEEMCQAGIDAAPMLPIPDLRSGSGRVSLTTEHIAKIFEEMVAARPMEPVSPQRRLWRVTIAIPNLNLYYYISAAYRPTYEQIRQIWDSRSGSKQELRPMGWRGPLADAYPGIGAVEPIDLDTILGPEEN